MNRLNLIISEVVESAKNKKKHSAFTIGNTTNINNPYLLFPKIRETYNLVCGNALISSNDQAEKIMQLIDGKVDYIFADAESKLKSVISLDALAKKIVKKSKVLTFKPNDLTVDALDALLAQLIDINGNNVTIIGSGNIGTKIAIRLFERGANIIITRSEKDIAENIVQTINYIAPLNSRGVINSMTDNNEACTNADIIIVCTPGIPVINDDLIKRLKNTKLIIDVGIGNLTPEAIYLANKKNIKILTLDIRSGFSGCVTTILETENFLKNVCGSRKIGDHNLVAGGIIGKEGDFVVDNINKPKKVIGIADGKGDLIFNLNDVYKLKLKLFEELLNKQNY